MKTKSILGVFALTLVAAFSAVFVYSRFFQPEPKIVELQAEPAIRQVSLPISASAESLDFTEAIQLSIDAVVHVKVKQYREYAANPLYEFFFGEPQGEPAPLVGYGSGVIISKDGYIVTNNHVIDGSDEIAVVLNDKRELDAKLIGADPRTDLALLKVEAEDIRWLSFGDSDALQLGEWVLAIGNPYNLTSTVTAGIVSAKARNINILRSQEFSIESFIQTDAAVNPGNSGGALINIRGELVGINTAIASRTGAFSGYSFAIPVTIVSKIVEDLREYGEVQRALLGVRIQDVTAELAEEKKLDKIEGVYVSEATEDGAAREAGLKSGDVIISIDGIKVNSSSELQETVSRYRPGDEVKVVIKRGGKLKPYTLVLRNFQGGVELARTQEDVWETIGADLEALDEKDKEKLGLSYGVKVTKIRQGTFAQNDIEEGFVILSINKSKVNTVKEVVELLKNSEGVVLIEGIDRKGRSAHHVLGM